eukprot:3639870-Prymnesium_polylepis.1
MYRVRIATANPCLRLRAPRTRRVCGERASEKRATCLLTHATPPRVTQARAAQHTHRGARSTHAQARPRDCPTHASPAHTRAAMARDSTRLY